ncbi:MAG TPA: SsgA family sporulation/cell division regulator [Nakamurella sp.]
MALGVAGRPGTAAAPAGRRRTAHGTGYPRLTRRWRVVGGGSRRAADPQHCLCFGRDLLITGTAMPSGLGDVQVYPTYDGVIIELRCGPHRVALLTQHPGAGAFLDRTLAMVPTDAELDHCDSAAELVFPDHHHDNRSPADGRAHPPPPRPGS